jgi:hypothetical protein
MNVKKWFISLIPKDDEDSIPDVLGLGVSVRSFKWFMIFLVSILIGFSIFIILPYVGG